MSTSIGITIKDFLFALLLAGYTVEKQAVTFKAWNPAIDYIIFPEDGGWMIASELDGRFFDHLLIQDFYDQRALTGV